MGGRRRNWRRHGGGGAEGARAGAAEEGPPPPHPHVGLAAGIRGVYNGNGQEPRQGRQLVTSVPSSMARIKKNLNVTETLAFSGVE